MVELATDYYGTRVIQKALDCEQDIKTPRYASFSIMSACGVNAEVTMVVAADPQYAYEQTRRACLEPDHGTQLVGSSAAHLAVRQQCFE